MSSSYAVTDDRVLNGTPIHGGIGADIHVVTDPHRAQLRHPNPLTMIRRHTEAVSTNNRARMHDAALADQDVMQYGDISD